ncbi:ABC transporter substrate-binding protein [Methylophaga sp.]|uniref:ABC transporter substrate-binding protein n=1 Tax=Methylophaga sp. TaxID=2024840 RepID=UPI001400599C|nr:helical backbone metal receptor [Methylophaga sp.]MTI62655.1 ABC transporter substrate-binding protein [Methylophaga sp.]
MRRFWPLIIFVVILVLIGLLSLRQAPTPQPQAEADYERIISLAPSITETLYAIGLGDKLVAVTDYCDYPPAARELPRVGGYTDTSLEAIVARQPDLVIMLEGQQQLRQQLNQLDVNTHSIDNSSLLGIQAAIASIGQVTGHERQADDLLADIEQQITAVRAKVESQPPVRTLVSIAHYVNSDQLETVYVAGQHDFYNDLLKLAGGVNVYQGTRVMVPSVSEEGLIRMNPDVIIDVFPEADDHHSNMDQVMQQWQQLETVNAVQSGRVHIIQRDYGSVPGPRIFMLLRDFARLLHPQLNWNEADHD